MRRKQKELNLVESKKIGDKPLTHLQSIEMNLIPLNKTKGISIGEHERM